MVCNPLVLALAPLPDAKPSVQRETQAHGKDELTSVLWGQRITITEITFLIRGSQQCLGKPPYIKILSHLLYSLLQARQSQFSLLSYGERPTWSKSFSFLAVSYKISRLQCPKLDTVFQTAVNQCSAARSNYISGLTHHAPLHPSCVDTAFPNNPGAVVGDKSWPVCALTKSMHSVLRCSALLEIPYFTCKWNKHLFLSQFPASFITPPAQQRAPWWWRGCWLLSIKPTGLGFWWVFFLGLWLIGVPKGKGIHEFSVWCWGTAEIQNGIPGILLTGAFGMLPFPLLSCISHEELQLALAVGLEPGVISIESWSHYFLCGTWKSQLPVLSSQF